MKRLILRGLFAVALSARFAALGGPVSQPNLVLILADDLGYGDVQCYNPDRGRIPTPNLDRLAAQGMRFTDAHSSSGVCSPSRYALLTGRYHWRTGRAGIVPVFGRPMIPADRLTVPSLLKEHGYLTAAIGKWHLGWDWPIPPGKEGLFHGRTPADEETPTEAQRTVWRDVFSRPIPGGPTSRGFKTYFGTDVPNWPPFCFLENDRVIGMPDVFLPSRLVGNNQASLHGPALQDWKLEDILPALGARACEFIAAAVRSGKPFLLYLPLTSPHTPLAVTDEWKGRSKLNLYADFVMQTDAVVGRVLDALDQHSARNDTLVVFSSDNGCAPYVGAAELETLGHFPSGPLRGYKSDIWEGGHRVPFMVRWPGRVQPGTVCSQLVQQADLLATCADILDVKLPANAAEDSFSLLPLLRGHTRPARETAVNQSIQGLLAVRKGPWKLIFGPGSGGWSKGGDEQPAQLYNVAEDVAEKRNLFADEPEVVTDLTRLMKRIVNNGRSTPGPPRTNDAPMRWKISAGAKTQAVGPERKTKIVRPRAAYLGRQTVGPEECG